MANKYTDPSIFAIQLCKYNSYTDMAGMWILAVPIEQSFAVITSVTSEDNEITLNTSRDLRIIQWLLRLKKRPEEMVSCSYSSSSLILSHNHSEHFSHLVSRYGCYWMSSCADPFPFGVLTFLFLFNLYLTFIYLMFLPTSMVFV